MAVCRDNQGVYCRGTFTGTSSIVKIVDREFVNQRVDLDYHYFESCTFRRCTLVFHGHGAVKLKNNHFDDCRFKMGEAAENTLYVLQEMYHGRFQSFVEHLFEQVQEGAFDGSAIR